ncbi:V-type proton ATPase subunit F [Drosophila guanche]|uniref:V-type proton ATPase subunit F n=1 Tax=Drosophila guanche TaxID=7266 RepID=A0A3B0JHP4_DROGU|nr:V-type proton ATPase subunit F [Drosophila guanche]SPP80223.1 blast:V-type proton ATPase subunit F [Drosophila guanche]
MSINTETFDKLIAVIGDEDTCVGFLLGGIGEVSDGEDRERNFFVVEQATTAAEIAACFTKFLKRPDIGIILINQIYADMIRPTVDAHLLPLPTVVEIPSKQQPYDASKDSVMKRAYGIINPPRRRH